MKVEVGVSVETGSVIDLEEPRFQAGIEHDIESEQFKTHFAVFVLRLAGSEDVSQMRLH